LKGASLGVPFFTAYKALILRAQTKPGETVLIHGASGAVGTAAVQIARYSVQMLLYSRVADLFVFFLIRV